MVPASVAALFAVLISLWALWPQAPGGSDLPGQISGGNLTGKHTAGAGIFGPVPDEEFYLSEHRNVEEEYTFSGTSLAGNLGSGGS